MTEHELQVAIIQWADLKANQDPAYSKIFAVPNGGHRDVRVARKLKAEGVRAGVLDLAIMVARHGYHGAFIELKISPNKPSKAQQWWIEALTSEGYICQVIYDDPCEAIRWIEWYIDGDAP